MTLFDNQQPITDERLKQAALELHSAGIISDAQLKTIKDKILNRLNLQEKKKPIPKKSTNPNLEIFKECQRFWLTEFHPGWTFSKTCGSSLYEIIKQLKSRLTATRQNVSDSEVSDLFKVFCKGLPEWFKNKDLQTLNSKFNTIFEEIKNSINGKSTTNGGSKYRANY